MRDGAGRVGRPSPVRGGEGLGQEKRCQAECWWPREEAAPGSWRVQGGCWGRGGRGRDGPSEWHLDRPSGGEASAEETGAGGGAGSSAWRKEWSSGSGRC